jgi:glycosyltransferase involved in cell wall biosynthesis
MKAISFHASAETVMEGISYIITTYNRNHLLEQCIHSILSERVLPSELLLIDDAGNVPIELSDAIQLQFGDALRIIRNPKNLGVIGARNVGIQVAQYDFLIFLDDDDESFPNRSQDLLAHIVESDYAFVSGKCEMHLPNGMRIVPYTPQIEYDPLLLLMYPVHINGIIWRKKSLLALGGMDYRVPYFGEYVTMNLLILKGEKALQIEPVVARFFYIEAGLTNQVIANQGMKQQLLAFYEVLMAESQNTSFHAVYQQIYELLPEQTIHIFEDYWQFAYPILANLYKRHVV